MPQIEVGTVERQMTVGEYARYRRTSAATIRRRIQLGMPAKKRAGMPTIVDVPRADRWHIEDLPEPRRGRGRPRRGSQ